MKTFEEISYINSLAASLRYIRISISA